MKLKFNNTINTGDLLTVIGLTISVVCNKDKY